MPNPPPPQFALTVGTRQRASPRALLKPLSVSQPGNGLDRSLDHPLHLGASQAERGLTTHRHPVMTLSALRATVVDRAHDLGVATPDHLLDQTIIIGGWIPGMGMLKRAPMIRKARFEDAPIPRGGGTHQAAPSWGEPIVSVQLFYHD